MAQKRKAQEAFGKPKGQLSAFAAAKLARQASSDPQDPEDGETLATLVGEEPYDGHHSGATTPPPASVGEDAIVTPPKAVVATQLSTWRPRAENVVKDAGDCLEITLQHDETATLIGEYEILVLNGIVTIYGMVLRTNSSPQRIYAPSTLALPQIQARQPNTAIRISTVDSGLKKLEKLSPLFRNISVSNTSSQRSFAFLGTTADDPLQRSLTALEVERDADAVLRTLSAKVATDRTKPRIMTVGAKSSGKSTFNRVLCNHLHSWIPAKNFLYLDLDPGQPEFSPPGQISLVEVAAPILGPPFAHPASSRSPSYKLIRSHTLAASSFKDNPDHYTACALDLIRYAGRQHPLIVNSCGWVNGLGASVLHDLTRDLSISDIILLEPLESSFVESFQSQSPNISIHRVARRAPRPSSRTPAEQRAMQTMAYFHHKPALADGNLRWSGKPINKTRPWIVSYTGANAGISAILSYDQNPSPEFLSEVLNGSLVALVVSTEPDKTDPSFPTIERTPEELPYYTGPNTHGIVPALNPSTTQFLALALIRGIDTTQKTLHLVTPLRESEVAQQLMGRSEVFLVRGGFDCPEWAYLEDLYHADGGEVGVGERPWVGRSGGGGSGIEGKVWRLRRPPLAPGGGM